MTFQGISKAVRFGTLTEEVLRKSHLALEEQERQLEKKSRELELEQSQLPEELQVQSDPDLQFSLKQRLENSHKESAKLHTSREEVRRQLTEVEQYQQLRSWSPELNERGLLKSLDRMTVAHVDSLVQIASQGDQILQADFLALLTQGLSNNPDAVLRRRVIPVCLAIICLGLGAVLFSQFSTDLRPETEHEPPVTTSERTSRRNPTEQFPQPRFLISESGSQSINEPYLTPSGKPCLLTVIAQPSPNNYRVDRLELFDKDGGLINPIERSETPEHGLKQSWMLLWKEGFHRVNFVVGDKLGSRDHPATIFFHRKTNARLFLVMIGVNEPVHGPRLSSAHHDAEKLCARFQEASSGLFKEILVPRPETNGTAENRPDAFTGSSVSPSAVLDIFHQLEKDMKAEDVAVVLFSSHAELLNGQFVLNVADTSTVSGNSDQMHGRVLFRSIAEILGRTQGRILCCLDTCHSGAAIPEIAALVKPESDRDEHQEGIILYTSCGAQELSEPDLKRNHGALVSALLDGLTEEAADLNQNGTLELKELNQWLRTWEGKDAEKFCLENPSGISSFPLTLLKP